MDIYTTVMSCNATVFIVFTKNVLSDIRIIFCKKEKKRNGKKEGLRLAFLLFRPLLFFSPEVVKTKNTVLNLFLGCD